MKQFSLVWWINVLLKLIAVATLINPIVQYITGTFTGSSEFSTRLTILGHYIYLTSDQAALYRAVTNTGTAFAHALLYWGAAEGLRMIANTEAYSRGVYTALRSKPQQNKSKQATSRSASPLPQEHEQHYAEAAVAAQKPKPGMSSSSVSFDSLEPATSSNLRYSPPDRVRQQRGQQRAPTRRVTVFRDRAEHQERPARPSGTIEVVDSLDGGTVNSMRTQGLKPINDALPFDEVS